MVSCTWLQVVVVLASLAVMLAVTYLVVRSRLKGNGKGIGFRVVQMFVAGIIAPGVLILAVTGVLDREGTTGLLSVMIGYTLTSLAPRNTTDDD